LKKFLSILFAAMLIFVLAACGSDSTSKEEEGNKSSEKETATTESTKKESEPAEEAESTTEGGTAIGETVSKESGDHKLVSLAEDVGTFESGPIKMNITKVNGVSSELSGDFATMMETDHLEYIQVDMDVENTSDENITFYASQATLVTDTGEQLDPEMLFSEHIDGEFLGKVKKSGTNFYILKNSKAADVKHVKLVYSGASNENFENIGDDVTVEVDLKQ